MNDQNNFSDIPSLNDTEGLDTYLQNQALQSQGLPTAETNTQTQQPAVNETQQPQETTNVQNFSREQLQTLLARVDEINAKLNNTQSNNYSQPRQVQAQSQQQSQPYTAQERTFIVEALNKGYSIDQINSVILQKRQSAAPSVNSQIEQRMAALENYIRSQEYQAAEAAFINKTTEFGNKWGLSEQDLTTFANAALEKGINIAMANVDLETVFKAIYPEQYAIRAQRMQPTHTSQIYGGTSVPEGTRRTAAKAEDMYVEAFLKNSMPNQYGVKK